MTSVTQLLDCLRATQPDLHAALCKANGLTTITLSPGDVLLRKGEMADALYVITAGTLRATITDDAGAQLTLSEFSVPELVGELAILSGAGCYSADVTASSSCSSHSYSTAGIRGDHHIRSADRRRIVAELDKRVPRDQLAIGSSNC